jgi:hypothetical protein
MTRRITVFKVCAEVIVAAVIGFVIATKSAWWDPDSVIAFHWIPILLIVGLLFGLFGHCPILLIGPIMASSGILVEILDVFHYGFSAYFLKFYALYFALMAIVVIIGAAIGRGVKRSWIYRRQKHAA